MNASVSPEDRDRRAPTSPITSIGSTIPNADTLPWGESVLLSSEKELNELRQVNAGPGARQFNFEALSHMGNPSYQCRGAKLRCRPIVFSFPFSRFCGVVCCAHICSNRPSKNPYV